jgi:signal transduction histidine kinase
MDSPVKHRFAQTALEYMLAGLLGSCAIGARYALDPWLGDSQSLSLLFAAVALTIWMCGLGPAIALATGGYIVSDFLFIPPRGVLAVANTTEAVALGTYIVSCAAIIGFGYGMRTAQRRALDYASRLEVSKSELEQAQRRKDEFLAILAHELRNPLAPIRTALALMIPREPELSMARNVIQRQSRHLQRMVDDLSDLSRIREGKIGVEKVPTSILPILTDAIESVRPALAAARQTLDLKLTEERVVVSADATRLTQVFANLLSNAVRYTPEGGQIQVELRREASSVVVSVTDNGIGIPAGMLTRIFDMYDQGSAPVERSKQGLGIGLALASRLVWLHGGTIEAFSAGAGNGSSFTVRLPLVPAVNAVAPTAPVFINPPRREEAQVAGVLIVSSRADFVDRFAARLTRAGLKVHSASSEAEAMRAGARAQPCAVVVDLDDTANAHWICRALRLAAWGMRAFIIGVNEKNGPSTPGRTSGILDFETSDAKEVSEALLRKCMPLSVDSPEQTGTYR